jgi:hypothetical protein
LPGVEVPQGDGEGQEGGDRVCGSQGALHRKGHCLRVWVVGNGEWSMGTCKAHKIPTTTNVNAHEQRGEGNGV